VELTKAERAMIGRRATKRIVSKIGKLKRKEKENLTLMEAYNTLVAQRYEMLDRLNAKENT